MEGTLELERSSYLYFVYTILLTVSGEKRCYSRVDDAIRLVQRSCLISMVPPKGLALKTQGGRVKSPTYYPLKLRCFRHPKKLMVDT